MSSQGPKNTENTRRNSQVTGEPSGRRPSEPRTPTSPTASESRYPQGPPPPYGYTPHPGAQYIFNEFAHQGAMENGYPTPKASLVKNGKPGGGALVPFTAPQTLGQPPQNGYAPHPGYQQQQQQQYQYQHQYANGSGYQYPNQGYGPYPNQGYGPYPMYNQQPQQPPYGVHGQGGGVNYYTSNPSLTISGNVNTPLVLKDGNHFSVQNVAYGGPKPQKGGQKGKGKDGDIEEKEEGKQG